MGNGSQWPFPVIVHAIAVPLLCLGCSANDDPGDDTISPLGSVTLAGTATVSPVLSTSTSSSARLFGIGGPASIGVVDAVCQPSTQSGYTRWVDGSKLDASPLTWGAEFQSDERKVHAFVFAVEDERIAREQIRNGLVPVTRGTAYGASDSAEVEPCTASAPTRFCGVRIDLRVNIDQQFSGCP